MISSLSFNHTLFIFRSFSDILRKILGEVIESFVVLPNRISVPIGDAKDLEIEKYLLPLVSFSVDISDTWKKPALVKGLYSHEPSGFSLQNSIYFLKRKLFSYFRKCNPGLSGISPPKKKFSLKKFITFFPRKPTVKKFLIFSQKKPPNFQETETPKNSFYFRKRKFLILQETDLSYISGKVYSKP